MMDALVGSAAVLTALLAAVTVVLCVAGMLHWGHDREAGLIPYLFYPAILAATLGVALSGRNLDIPLQLQLDLQTRPPLDAWASRATALFLLLAAAERIGRRMLHQGKKPDAPMALMLALVFYFLTNVVTPALLGRHPGFAHEYVYTFIACYAALLAARPEGDLAVRSMRNVLFAFLVLSALFVAWRPEMVLSRTYALGLIPGFTVRYAGLASSANTLGPVVVAFLLCLWSRPYSARWFNALAWAMGLASLVLTQSKTNWIAFVISAACLAYFRSADPDRQRGPGSSRRPAVVSMAILIALAIGVALMFFGVGDRVAAFFGTREGAGLLTLSGRERIWEVAVEEWRNNPLFGYGLTIWDSAYRAQVGLIVAFNAHNQFYQSLSSAGIVGVTGLAVYVATLSWFVLKTTKASKGLSLALFGVVLIESISEVPLSMTSSFDMVQLTHLLLLLVVASAFVSARAGSGGRKALARRHDPVPIYRTATGRSPSCGSCS